MKVQTSESDPMNVQTNVWTSKVVITLNSLKLWRPMRTFWKVHQVHFPMPQSPPYLDIAIKSYVWISQDCSEGQ